MKFDLFDAMHYVNQKLGTAGEILVRDTGGIYRIRISVYVNEDFHHHEFAVTKVEAFEDECIRFNLEFRRAVKSLEVYVDGNNS